MAEEATVEDPQNTNENQIDMTDPKISEFVKSQVAAALEKAGQETQGLKNNRDEILKEKKELQEKHEALMQQFGGIDAETLKNHIERLKHDEDSRLISEGKIDEVVDKRVGLMKKDFNDKEVAYNKKIAELEGIAAERMDKIDSLILDNAVSSAATRLKVSPGATPDLLHRARSVFSRDENDRLVARDGDGTVLVGKDGTSPLTVEEWTEKLRDQAPHLFEGSTGAGAAGGAGGARGGTVNIARKPSSTLGEYTAAKKKAEESGRQINFVTTG